MSVVKKNTASVNIWRKYFLLQGFEVMPEGAGVLTPKFNLEPPHYDGIQSLAIQGNTLFSGSRDTCIKKWDLENRALVQVSLICKSL